jgi:replicative superfamily II helicase
MVDFTKHITRQTLEQQTDPLEIYERLDRLSDTGTLRPAQEYILKEWHTHRRTERDLIVKLHTGQGKTVIGLLILLSRLNEGAGPALYLCPNKYLVDQTCFQAQRFGIGLINGNSEDDLPVSFLNGDKIYVCTIQKLFNGLTKFGLNASSINVQSVLMDDCHACIDIMRQACSISLKSDSQAYIDIRNLFAVDLQEQGAGTFADILSGEYNSFLPVPFWSWNDRRDEVTKILSAQRHSDSVKFVWPIIKDILDKCCCVLSGSGLEITPYLSPLSKFGSFYGAKYRVFMSATVTDDSFLVKGLRLSQSTITNPLTFPKEKWFGEKMIIIPTLIDSEINRTDIVNIFGAGDEKRAFGIVGLCPSVKASQLWKSAGADVPEKENVNEYVQRLIGGEFKKSICFVNRYDGIDLPDKACRILLLDSKPFSGGLIDRYLESCLPSSEVTAQRTARMIEQGIGRGVRGEKDYCTVILIGSDLVRAIQRSDVMKYYSSQTRRQIEIGIEIAKISMSDIAQGAMVTDVVINCINKLLQRDEGWKEFYVDRMSDVVIDPPDLAMLQLYATELSAEIQLENGRYIEAQKIIQNMLDTNHSISNEDRGWYTQEMARIIYRHSKSESESLQVTAHKINGYLLKPKNGIIFKKLEPLNQKRVFNIITWVRKSIDHQDLMIRINAIADDLRFGVDSDKFEHALNELGVAMGFASERPDKVWGKGPDNLWCIKSNHYLLFECKNEVKADRLEIAKTETGQINNSFAWFTEHYPGIQATCLMIISTKKITPAAGFNMPVMIVREKNLRNMTRNFISYFKEFNISDLNDIDPVVVQQWLKQHKLETDCFVENYAETPFK